MKLASVILLILRSIITESKSELKVVGPVAPLFVVAGEDLILPCYIKPNISAVDMSVEWFRLDLDNSLVHLYKDREDRNTKQIQSYRGRTALFEQELEKGNASLKLSKVRTADEGFYKCLIESKSWYDDITVNVKVEALGTPPVIVMEDYNAGGLNLVCQCKGWYPEPEVLWLDSDGVSLSSDVPETQRSTEGFDVKRRATIKNSDIKYHCRVIQRHHMLETEIIVSSKVLHAQQTVVIWISVLSVLLVILGVALAILSYKLTGQYVFSRHQRKRLEQEIKERRKHAVDVILDPDTAHPYLILSDDGKQVSCGDICQSLPDKKERFSIHYRVLGKEGFSSGRFYYEVQVKGKSDWYIGVARESTERKGTVTLCPENGCWTIRSYSGIDFMAQDSTPISLSLREKPCKVGVFVDYKECLISFYDVEAMFHIYSFTGQSFSGKLYPLVSPCYNYGGKNSLPLIITPLKHPTNGLLLSDNTSDIVEASL